MALKRSPRYPRHSISKSLNMAEKMFRGAHQSMIDVDSAARVLGYTNSSSGAAASALGSLRQYGLVDGLRGDMRVSDLAMRILQPMDATEKAEALTEAAMKPEIFGKIVKQFGGTLPPSDEPIRAFLIRNEGFSAGGAEDLIVALRATMSEIAMLAAREIASEAAVEAVQNVERAADKAVGDGSASASSRSLPPSLAAEEEGELIILPLGPSCRAELRFIGTLTDTAYSRLIRHLELLKEALAD